MKLFRLDKLFDFLPKSKIKAGDGKISGEFPLYTSSPKLTKYYDEPIYNTEGLVFGTGGLPSIHFVENKFSTSTDCIVIKRKGENILTKYVFYYLFGNIQILEKGFKGVGLKHISKRYIQEIKIPVPDLQIQEQIVSILDKAQGLIHKREQSLSLLDELLRATFLDMFGDPVLNEKKMKTIKLGDKNHFKIQGGGTPSKQVDEYYGGKVLWVTPKDMKYEIINKSKITITEHAIQKSSAKLIDPNSIIIVVRSGVLKHTFPVGINSLPITINQDLKAITPLTTSPYFTYWNIKLYEKYILTKVRAVTADNIDTKELLKFNILLPENQKEFEDIAEVYYSQKRKIKNSLKEINNLFQSLSQEAFNGDLKIKNNKLGLQSALDKIKWFDEQIKQVTSNTAIEKLQKQMEAFNKISKPFDQITKLQKQLDKFKIPNLEKIDQFQKSLEKFNIPQLKNITRSEDFLKLTQDNFLKEIGEKQAFKIKGLENIAEEEKQKEIEEELKIENDPVLQFIGSEQIGKFTVDNYKINVARAIHKFFGKREFDIDSLVEVLKNEKGIINVRKAAVKKDLFKIFKEFITKKHYGMFSFENMRQSMKKHLFNPSFELLQEFIDSEMKLKSEDKLSQVYFDDLHQKPSDPFYNDKSLFEKNRVFQLHEERIYLQYKIKADED